MILKFNDIYDHLLRIMMIECFTRAFVMKIAAFYINLICPHVYLIYGNSIMPTFISKTFRLPLLLTICFHDPHL
jgi:hypothetical protein